MLCPFQRVQAAKRAETEKKALIEINEYHQMNESELKRTLDLGPKNNNKKNDVSAITCSMHAAPALRAATFFVSVLVAC